MSDEVSCACPRCWTELHVEMCGDINCTGECRIEEETVVEPLSEEDLAEMQTLTNIPEGLSTRAERERLEDLRRRHVGSMDDRVE